MFKDLSFCSLKNKLLTLRVKLFKHMHSLLQHEIHYENGSSSPRKLRVGVMGMFACKGCHFKVSQTK